MAAAFYLLLVIGHLGFFDVLYYHSYQCGLHRRSECQREVLWHTMRHLLYGCQFLVIANLRFHDSEDWKSIIGNGRGVWLYESRPEGTYFKTVYDYERRYGMLGRALDRLLFPGSFSSRPSGASRP